MTAKLVCPSCGQELRLKDTVSSTRVKCPACTHVFSHGRKKRTDLARSDSTKGPLIQEATSPANGPRLTKTLATHAKSLGWTLAVTGGVLLAAVSTAVEKDFLPNGMFGLIVLCGVAALGLVLVYTGNRLVNVGKRSLAESANEIFARDKRAPVLYLRSFQQDGEVTKETGQGDQDWLPNRTLEEDLAEALSVIGPVVAIGKPGEPLPEVGAARMYVDNDKWQETVLRLISSAKLVVLRPGGTEGFWWEVKQAFDLVSPGHLLFYFPDGMNTDVKKQYERWRNKVRHFTTCELPENIGNSRFVWFDANGKAHALRRRSKLFQEHRLNGSQCPTLRAELQPLLEYYGVQSISRNGLSILRVLGLLLITVTALVVFVLLFSRVMSR